MERKTTKKELLKRINAAYGKMCLAYGVPSNQLCIYSYHFAPYATMGFSRDSLERYAIAYERKAEEVVVEPATEKQLAFISRLSDELDKKILDGAVLNKTSASYVIEVLKMARDCVYNSNIHMTRDDFVLIEDELRMVVELSKTAKKCA